MKIPDLNEVSNKFSDILNANRFLLTKLVAPVATVLCLVNAVNLQVQRPEVSIDV